MTKAEELKALDAAIAAIRMAREAIKATGDIETGDLPTFRALDSAAEAAFKAEEQLALARHWHDHCEVTQ